MKTRKIVFCIGLIIILLVVSSCAFSVEGVKGLFASKTPTSTNTPTSTATSTVTSTATSTPKPPISLYPCAFNENCPEATLLVKFIEEELTDADYYEVEFPFDQSIQLATGWYALDEGFLEENLSHINWIFTIDGQDYFNVNWLEQGHYWDVDDPSVLYPGMWFGVVMEGWKIGEPHIVEIGFSIDSDIYDGWESVEAGTTYLQSYRIIPARLPTATPTATQTRTPTPRPTAIPYTSTPKPTLAPACSADGVIYIENNTGAWVTINLNGTAKYTFDVAAGNKTLNVCPGNYSWTVWGCGGAQDSGNVNNGETLTFSCVSY